MTNFSGERERYANSPDEPGVVPWARMDRRARLTWALLCLFNRMELDAVRARFNPRTRVVMAIRDSDVPGLNDSEHVDPSAPAGGGSQRRVIVTAKVEDEAWSVARIRMIYGDRLGEIEALVDDEDAGRPRIVKEPKGEHDGR